MNSNPPLSLDERLNAATHALGLILSCVGLILLLSYSSQPLTRTAQLACVIFGGSLITLYASSTLYHLSQKLHLKTFWKRCDHIAIFFLIAGSYTPFCLIVRPSAAATELLTVVWTLAGIGAVSKIFFAGRVRWLSTVLYLILGWLVVWKWDVILVGMPHKLLLWLVAGGLFYSLGALFYMWRSLRFNHAIWHLFVLGGSACHFMAVMLFLSNSEI